MSPDQLFLLVLEEMLGVLFPRPYPVQTPPSGQDEE